MYEIRYDIPRPKKVAGPKGPRKYPWDQLEVGGSFLVPGKKVSAFAPHAVKMGQKYNRKFGCSTMFMRLDGERWEPCEPTDEGAVEGVGVWRTE